MTFLSGFGISTLTWEIAVHPTNSETLYVGQTGYMFRDLHRSTYGGNTFENLHITNSENSIEEIRFDPINPSIIYVCAQNKGIFKSTDDGKNRFTINNGLKIADSIYSVYLSVS